MKVRRHGLGILLVVGSPSLRDELNFFREQREGEKNSRILFLIYRRVNKKTMHQLLRMISPLCWGHVPQPSYFRKKNCPVNPGH